MHRSKCANSSMTGMKRAWTYGGRGADTGEPRVSGRALGRGHTPGAQIVCGPIRGCPTSSCRRMAASLHRKAWSALFSGDVIVDLPRGTAVIPSQRFNIGGSGCGGGDSFANQSSCHCPRLLSFCLRGRHNHNWPMKVACRFRDRLGPKFPFMIAPAPCAFSTR